MTSLHIYHMPKIKKSDNTVFGEDVWYNWNSSILYTWCKLVGHLEQQHGTICQKLNLHIPRDSTFLFPVAAEQPCLIFLFCSPANILCFWWSRRAVLLPCKHPVLLMVQESSSSLWALQFFVSILCWGCHLLGLAKLQALPPTPKCCISYCLNWPEPSCSHLQSRAFPAACTLLCNWDPKAVLLTSLILTKPLGFLTTSACWHLPIDQSHRPPTAPSISVFARRHQWLTSKYKQMLTVYLQHCFTGHSVSTTYIRRIRTSAASCVS